MDNVLIVVDDLKAAIAFFVELGLEVEGRMMAEGDWVDRTIGLKDTRAEIVMLRPPDRHGAIELTRYHRPAAIGPAPRDMPVNTLGYRRVMFAVDDLDDVLERLRPHGAELVDEVVQYENAYRLCFVRGPEGIVGLAQRLGGSPAT